MVPLEEIYPREIGKIFVFVIKMFKMLNNRILYFTSQLLSDWHINNNIGDVTDIFAIQRT